MGSAESMQQNFSLDNGVFLDYPVKDTILSKSQNVEDESSQDEDDAMDVCTADGISALVALGAVRARTPISGAGHALGAAREATKCLSRKTVSQGIRPFNLSQFTGESVRRFTRRVIGTLYDNVSRVNMRPKPESDILNIILHVKAESIDIALNEDLKFIRALVFDNVVPGEDNVSKSVSRAPKRVRFSNREFISGFEVLTHIWMSDSPYISFYQCMMSGIFDLEFRSVEVVKSGISGKMELYANTLRFIRTHFPDDIESVSADHFTDDTEKVILDVPESVGFVECTGYKLDVALKSQSPKSLLISSCTFGSVHFYGHCPEEIVLSCMSKVSNILLFPDPEGSKHFRVVVKADSISGKEVFIRKGENVEVVVEKTRYSDAIHVINRIDSTRSGDFLSAQQN